MRHEDDRLTTPACGVHVVVVGGGFGGLRTARALSTRRARRAGLRVTLVDRHNHHTFQPLLYQVATAGLQPQDIGISLRATLRRRGVAVRVGEVVAVDAAVGRLRFADGGTLDYDRLVLAAGAIAEDFGVPGVAAHAYGLKSLADATTLRNAVLSRFEAASAAPGGTEDGVLTFVVAGGGPTGVELAGALAELVDLVVRRDHPELDLARVRILLLEPRDRLLGAFTERSSAHALEQLQRRGVEVRLGIGVARAAADEVVLTDGEVVPTRTLVWAAGVAASPLAASLGVPLAAGRRLPVDEHLRVRGVRGVFAIGDLAAFPAADGGLLPQVAPVAMQQGSVVAATLVAEVTGQTAPPPFAYRDKGSMATVGRAAAVAELPGGLRLRGLAAWVAWLGLHLLMLVGFKNRFGVLVSWIWNYATVDHAARLILDQREAATVETSNGWVRRTWAA
ncbi:NAD(P)/FAD-dependent oxidoreductase [Egicoccus halophilus]|uniref:NADH:ubiquinone reductase (non-electrogenic) n=1 Tax=Egicoccus halophilus TaxID=1670830 RepID=A0A8J3A591_9ACTN|nr:NAD(P)/FAD-dependent oxidoreductase [Egicoccus halophilus]GGI03197.1 pyridine nucleotide-disulfide oxidoreductase [Egicoccus halophilus]